MLSVLRFKNIGGSINGKFLNQKIKGKATGGKGCWSGTNNKLNLACNTWTYHWQKTWRLVLNVIFKKSEKRGKCKGKHEVFNVLFCCCCCWCLCQGGAKQVTSLLHRRFHHIFFLLRVAKFFGKLETTLRIAQLLSVNCELRCEVATFIRHELDSELRDGRNKLFFLLMFQKSKPCTLIPAWESKQMLFLPSIRNFY